MNPDDVVIPLNSRWLYTAPDAKPDMVFIVVDLPKFHAGPDTWVDAVSYMALVSKEQYAETWRNARKVRTKSDFLAAFRPA